MRLAVPFLKRDYLCPWARRDAWQHQGIPPRITEREAKVVFSWRETWYRDAA